MKHLCSIPWTGFSNEPDGRVQPCCLYKGYITDEDNKPLYVQKNSVNEIFKSKFMNDLRAQFRSGEKPQGCSTCWVDEENGYESKRLIYNKKIKRDFQIDFDSEPERVRELQLIINNSCNLKCRSCTPSHSSQWQLELKAIKGNTGYDMPNGQSADETGKLWTERFDWYEDLRRLEVVGGEPFYVKQWHQIFNELIDNGYSKNIDITLTTNCTLFFPELVEKLSKNFKSISVGLSIDGIGSVYEYLRHPGKWDITYKNIEKYYEYVDNLNLQFNITISWLNAFQLPELHELIKVEFPKAFIWNNIVHFPTHLSLYNIPDFVKNDIREKWSNYSWDKKYIDIINSLETFMYSKNCSETDWKQSLQILYRTDEFRKEKLLNSIPYFQQYINS